MKRIAIVPGSFDPLTAGHADVIRTAASLFDEVKVVVLVNSEKSGTFTPEERLTVARAAVAAMKEEGIGNVTAHLYSGLTADAARELGASFVVKGLRSAADFDYEFGMAEITRRFDSGLTTVFLPSRPEFMHVSSTYVREIIKYGRGDDRAFAAGTRDLILTIAEDKTRG